MRCGVSGKRLLGGAIGDAVQDLLPQRRQRRRCRLELAFEPVGQQRQAGADVADDLGMGEEHLLDIGRGVADMDHLRARSPMMNGGFSTVSCPIARIRSALSIAS